MVVKAGAAGSNFLCINAFFVSVKTAVLHHRLKRTAAGQRIGLVCYIALVDRLPHMTVALVVMNRSNGSVDWDFVKIWTSQSRKLRVCIRK